MRLNSAQVEADEQFEACNDAIGVGSEGHPHDEVKQCEGKLRVDALDAAEPDEGRVDLFEPCIFADFNEEEYSWRER